jgi:hypothetical protein
MKKITLTVLVTTFVALGYSFKTIHDLKKSSAEVNEVAGIYIFSDSKPLMEYEVIGEVGLAFATTQSPAHSNLREVFVKKLKDKYPTGEALIFKNDPYGGTHKADVIVFKK